MKKNLDLNVYGVSEINAAEMQTTNGGWLSAIGWLLIGICVAELCDRNAGKDFAEGQQAFRDSH
jgi:hypothetical protein